MGNDWCQLSCSCRSYWATTSIKYCSNWSSCTLPPNFSSKACCTSRSCFSCFILRVISFVDSGGYRRMSTFGSWLRRGAKFFFLPLSIYSNLVFSIDRLRDAIQFENVTAFPTPLSASTFFSCWKLDRVEHFSIERATALFFSCLLKFNSFQIPFSAKTETYNLK